MIVPAMSNEAVIKEALADLEIVKRKSEYTIKDIRKQLIKTKKYPFVKTYDYITPKTKNNWIYLVEFRNKNEIFQSFINYHHTDIGLRAALVTRLKLYSEEDEIVFFTGHFFSRFAERENLPFVNPIDKMKRFFMLNPEIMFAEQKELPGGGKEIIGTGTMGVVLGIKSKTGIFICNTYLSNDLLRKDQTLITSELKDELDYYLKIEKEILTRQDTIRLNLKNS